MVELRMIKDVSVMLKDISTVRNTLREQDLDHPVKKKKIISFSLQA